MRQKIIFTDDDVIKIMDHYNKGCSCEKISKTFNVSRPIISKILKEKGILHKGYSNGLKIELNDDIKEKIKHLYLNEFKSLLEISFILNLNENFLDKYLGQSGFRRSKSEGVSVGLVKRFSGVTYNVYLENINELKKYRSDVMKITNKQFINILPNYEKRGISGIDGVFHLDHKYSIMEGFKNNISPEIIGNIKNLEFIPWKENLKKRTKCSINKEQLLNIK